MRLLKKALYFAAKAHEGQTRKYNRLNLDPTPYILHPMAVAAKAAEDGLPLEVQAAAFLHDVLEDTPTTVDELSEHFPAYTVNLVVELTNPSHTPEHEFKPRAERKRIDREHIKNASFYAKMLKLIDRTDNLQDMGEAPASFKRLYLEESKELLKVLEHTNSVLADELASAIVQLESTISP